MNFEKCVFGKIEKCELVTKTCKKTVTGDKNFSKLSPRKSPKNRGFREVGDRMTVFFLTSL